MRAFGLDHHATPSRAEGGISQRQPIPLPCVTLTIAASLK